MIILKFLGWLSVLWLLGSTIYSIIFHLKAYSRQSKRIQKGEVGKIYETLHKQTNWGTLIIIQIIKIVFVIAIAIFLLSPNINSSKQGIAWSYNAKSKFIEGCKGNSPTGGMTQKEMDIYCSCVLAKIIKQYPNPQLVEGDLPQEFVTRVGIECLKEIKELK